MPPRCSSRTSPLVIFSPGETYNGPACSTVRLNPFMSAKFIISALQAYLALLTRPGAPRVLILEVETSLGVDGPNTDDASGIEMGFAQNVAEFINTVPCDIMVHGIFYHVGPWFWQGKKPLRASGDTHFSCGMDNILSGLQHSTHKFDTVYIMDEPHGPCTRAVQKDPARLARVVVFFHALNEQPPLVLAGGCGMLKNTETVPFYEPPLALADYCAIYLLK